VSFDEFSKLMQTLVFSPQPGLTPDGRGFSGSLPVSPPPHLAGAQPLSGAAALQDLEAFQRLYGLDSAALRRIHSKFREVDRDGSGVVAFPDFCRLLRLERSPFAERLFSLFDRNRDGLVDLKEFIVGLANVGGDVREDKVRFAFELFDVDSSGYIHEAGLRQIVRATNLAPEKQLDRKVRWLLSQYDANGDGRISLAEFQSLARRFPNILFPAYALAASVAKLAEHSSGGE